MNDRYAERCEDCQYYRLAQSNERSPMSSTHLDTLKEMLGTSKMTVDYNDGETCRIELALAGKQRDAVDAAIAAMERLARVERERDEARATAEKFRGWWMQEVPGSAPPLPWEAHP